MLAVSVHALWKNISPDLVGELGWDVRSRSLTEDSCSSYCSVPAPNSLNATRRYSPRRKSGTKETSKPPTSKIARASV
jgi:hypothetical protein